MLVHHADAHGDGLVGRADRYPLPEQTDLAGIRRKEAVEHVHHGRLSRAVLADQAKDLPLIDGKGHIIIGQDAGKGFCNV